MPITYTSQDQVEVYRFSAPVAIAIPLAALFLQAFLPLRIHFFSLFDLPLLVVIFFAVARRSPVAGLLTGSLIGLLQDSLTHQPIGIYGIAKTVVGFGASSLGAKLDVDNVGARFLVTLFFSQGIPMLLSGDELGRTQRGNNNSYCQDNEVSWFAWPPTGTAARLLDFTRRLIRLRLDHPVFQRRRFFQGRRIHGSAVKDLSWLRPDGSEMTDEEWGNWHSRCLGLQLAGDAIEEMDDEGLPVRDETFLLLLNAHDEAVPFVLPKHEPHLEWELCLDTRDWEPVPDGRLFKGGEPYPLEGQTLAVLRQRAKESP